MDSFNRISDSSRSLSSDHSDEDIMNFDFDAGSAPRFSLPSWVFEIDDDEDLELLRFRNYSLLEELEINPKQIAETILWQLKCPFLGALRRFNCVREDHSREIISSNIVHSCIRSILAKLVVYDTSNPIQLVSTNTGVVNNVECESLDGQLGVRERGIVNKNNQHGNSVDFWGPAIIVTVFASLLWLGNQKNVPYVYMIWFIAAFLCHLTCRPYLKLSSVGFHLAILGYSLVPQIPLCFIILAFRPSLTTSTIIQFFCVIYSMTAALMSYGTIMKPLIETNEKSKLLLLLPMVLLFELYIITLVPIRSWQINHGEPIKIM